MQLVRTKTQEELYMQIMDYELTSNAKLGEKSRNCVLAYMIQGKEIPMYYLIGRLNNEISEQKLLEALYEYDFSEYICLHFNTDVYDFKQCAVVPRSFIYRLGYMYDYLCDEEVVIEFFDNGTLNKLQVNFEILENISRACSDINEIF